MIIFFYAKQFQPMGKGPGKDVAEGQGKRRKERMCGGQALEQTNRPAKRVFANYSFPAKRKKDPKKKHSEGKARTGEGGSTEGYIVPRDDRARTGRDGQTRGRPSGGGTSIVGRARLAILGEVSYRMRELDQKGG